mmetsp:Transcript_12202/g.24077  ORF Transcript_12202/g.24077 Transcript_12202/m.24077 type:complete len:201 (-) Transcript_12202:154-756(-)
MLNVVKTPHALVRPAAAEDILELGHVSSVVVVLPAIQLLSDDSLHLKLKLLELLVVQIDGKKLGVACRAVGRSTDGHLRTNPAVDRKPILNQLNEVFTNSTVQKPAHILENLSHHGAITHPRAEAHKAFELILTRVDAQCLIQPKHRLSTLIVTLATRRLQQRQQTPPLGSCLDRVDVHFGENIQRLCNVALLEIHFDDG